MLTTPSQPYMRGINDGVPKCISLQLSPLPRPKRPPLDIQQGLIDGKPSVFSHTVCAQARVHQSSHVANSLDSLTTASNPGFLYWSFLRNCETVSRTETWIWGQSGLAMWLNHAQCQLQSHMATPHSTRVGRGLVTLLQQFVAPLCAVWDQSQCSILSHESCSHNFSQKLQGINQLGNHKQLLCQTDYAALAFLQCE